jgi:predicted aspartyl protease
MIKKILFACIFLSFTYMVHAKNSLEKSLLKLGYEVVSITKLISGHICIKAKINGVEGLFILDTGANGTVLDLERKKKFLIQSNDSTVAVGAGASDLAVQSSDKNSMEVGGHIFKDVFVGVMDLSHVNKALASMGIEGIDGVIGITTLYELNAVVDCHDLKLFIKENK